MGGDEGRIAVSRCLAWHRTQFVHIQKIRDIVGLTSHTQLHTPTHAYSYNHLSDSARIDKICVDVAQQIALNLIHFIW